MFKSNLFSPKFLDIFEIITVGFPFCYFKLIAGELLLNNPSLSVLGTSLSVALILLGFIDSFLNVINLCSLIIGGYRLLPVCILSLIFEKLNKKNSHWNNLGISVDILLSFIIVALMIALGSLPLLTPIKLKFWNISVIFNVIGAGISRIASSIIEIKKRLV